MRESRTSGSVRGDGRNSVSYRDNKAKNKAKIGAKTRTKTKPRPGPSPKSSPGLTVPHRGVN